MPTSGNNTIEILIQFTLEVADAQIGLDDCTVWFKNNIEKIEKYPYLSL